MLESSASSPDLIQFVLLGAAIVLIGSVLRYYKQPYVLAYIVAGVLMGKHGMEILTDEKVIHNMGEIGLILLLFFIGMEINLPNLVKRWKVPVIGTLAQVFGTIALVGLIGYFFEWSINRIVVLGFIICLSSSAVVIKLLQDNNEFHTKTGQNVISILLMQDILFVPMLIISGYLGGDAPSSSELILQIIGGLLIIGLIVWIMVKKQIVVPFINKIEDDHELQVIIALIVCFGFALGTAFWGLSAALGAFVGGLFVNATKSTEWFKDSLHSFRILFVALFFVSVGMMIDLEFLVSNWKIITVILLLVYVSNHFINSVVLFYFERNWKTSLYGGALVAQVGELSFILASTVFYSNIISDFEYQLTVIVIALTLLISPFWIAISKKVLKI